MRSPMIRIMQPDFTFLAVLYDYTSLQYERKLYEVGNWEIHLQPSAIDLSVLADGNIMFWDEAHAGIIRSVEITESQKGNAVTVKGVQLKGLTDQRIVLPGVKSDTEYFGYDRFPDATDPDAPAESVMKHYADFHMVHPEDANRAFAGMVTAPDLERGIAMRWSARFDNLDTVLKGIGEWAGMGYDILLDLENAQMVFEVIAGEDHTASSASPVLFSTLVKNVQSTKYARDSKALKTTGYAGGAGEDENRLILSVYQGAEPTASFSRRETWLDCGSIELPEDLLYEGAYKLKDKAMTEAITGDLVQEGYFVYRQDWDLGDRVTVQCRPLGLELDARVTAVKEVYEPGKQAVTPTFGSRSKTILDEIRKQEVVT